MNYRPEIDGLRAIAVLAVMFFHAGFDWLNGGFVGVDVFFVISGYLITTILINDLAHQRFSLLRFYERRARRILPALFLVMLACIPFAWLWMLPGQMKDFSQSLLAVSAFVSNIFFWAKSGYFAPSADTLPLLHTWSLAVEEQFYLLFPVFLLLAWRLGWRALFVLIAAIAVISFAASEYGWRTDAVANFYLAHVRAWELLVGSLAALFLRERGRPNNNALALIGLGAVAASFVLFDETTPVPSVYALLPVLGTAAIIVFAGPRTLVARLLGTRALVGIGLISYSAYLWHQPVFAFTRIRFGETLPQAVYLLLIALSLGLAVLSWRFVELPFRHPRNLINNRGMLFLSGAIMVVCFGAFSFVGSGTGGFSTVTEHRQNLASLEARIEINYGMSEDCETRFTLSENCQTSLEPNVLLWGDSYAMHLAQGIIASKDGIRMQQHTISSCSPILGFAGLNVQEGRGFAWVQNCFDFNNAVLEWLEQTPSIEFVILSSPFDWVETEKIAGQDGSVREPDPAFLIKEFGKTIEVIRALGVGVVLVSPTPRSGDNIGNCLVRQLGYSGAGSCDFDYPNANFNDDFVSGLESHVPVYWLKDDICTGTGCATYQDGRMIYRDAGHLSKEGSALLGERYNWYEAMRALALSD